MRAIILFLLLTIGCTHTVLIQQPICHTLDVGFFEVPGNVKDATIAAIGFWNGHIGITVLHALDTAGGPVMIRMGPRWMTSPYRPNEEPWMRYLIVTHPMASDECTIGADVIVSRDAADMPDAILETMLQRELGRILGLDIQKAHPTDGQIERARRHYQKRN